MSEGMNNHFQFRIRTLFLVLALAAICLTTARILNFDETPTWPIVGGVLFWFCLVWLILWARGQRTVSACESPQLDERFTDRARKVMQLADQEARRFNHEYIGTEHVPLGLIEEGRGTATSVLKYLDVDLRKLRMAVEKIIQRGPDLAMTGTLPQTPRVRKAIQHSVEEARNLNHHYVGTEHILLGLLREKENVGAQLLMNAGLNLEDVREEVLNLLGKKP
jgi:ClpA/ClpB-like protein